MTLPTEQSRPMCSLCGVRPSRKASKSVHGVQRWRKHCAPCDNDIHRSSKIVDLTCSVCGFVAADACQIDSVEGRSVCSNCNRLNIKAAKQAKHDGYELTVDATVSIWDIRL